MMWSTFLPLLFLFAFTAGCNAPDPVAVQTQPASDTVQSNSKAERLNAISLFEKGGLKVAKAFLADEESHLLPSDNRVIAGQPVYLNLVVAGGWMAEKNVVSPGARQTITTENGEPVLSSPDLFAGTPSVAVSKASYLRLKAVITQVEKKRQAFVVHYRVWDKMGPGEITGSYRLLVERDPED